MSDESRDAGPTDMIRSPDRSLGPTMAITLPITRIVASSSRSSAYISSEARTTRARSNICACRSKSRLVLVDREVTHHLSELRLSPVLILSRLCLNRLFQFFGISDASSARTARTFCVVSSSMT